MTSETVDVLIVGSGPVGSAVARKLFESTERTTILMIERGADMGKLPFGHVQNLPDEAKSDLFIRLREHRSHRNPAEKDARSDVVVRPGTYLVDRGADPLGTGMPAAAESTNRGGMGAFWTGACPTPAGSEKIAFLDPIEMDQDMAVARSLLHVDQNAFPSAVAAERLREALGELYPATGGRPVQNMPMACTAQSAGPPLWSGSAVVLGPVGESDGEPGRFRFRSEVLCRQLQVDQGGRVQAAICTDLRTGSEMIIRAHVVVLACDAFRTPQLLWNSGLDSSALGHFLNDQARIVAAVTMLAPPMEDDGTRGDSLRAVVWVPYSEPDRLFHGQVTLTEMFPASPLALRSKSRKYVVGLTWYVPKDIRYEDRVWFTDQRRDRFGMPSIQIDYEWTALDHARIESAVDDLSRVATKFGGFMTPGGSPRVQQAGTSLHYQGSTRMGAVDNGASVCDTDGKVWGTKNVFVVGTGVIPAATACNPTLTAVALALRTARRIASIL